MRLIILALSLLVSTSSVAQTPPTPRPEAQQTYVTYTVEVMLPTTGKAAETLPVQLLQRLSAQPALVHLDVGDFQMQPNRLLAQFLFGNVEAYATWRSAAQTQALLDALDALTERPVRTALNLRSYPGAELIRH